MVPTSWTIPNLRRGKACCSKIGRVLGRSTTRGSPTGSGVRPGRRTSAHRLLGEHTSEVLREQAGLTDDDIAELVIDDVVGTVPIIAR